MTCASSDVDTGVSNRSDLLLGDFQCRLYRGGGLSDPGSTQMKMKGARGR
jgi:hypothetical protein